MNDNVPLTVEPVYYPHVNELTPARSPVISLEAVDRDLEKNKTITYKITGGNTFNLFSIDSTTGTCHGLVFASNLMEMDAFDTFSDRMTNNYYCSAISYVPYLLRYEF